MNNSRISLSLCAVVRAQTVFLWPQWVCKMEGLENKWNQEQRREKEHSGYLFIKNERDIWVRADPETVSYQFLTLPNVSTAASICFLQPAIPKKDALKPGLSHNQFLYASVQVTELKERLRPMRGFWVSLPHTICNDEKMATDVTNEDRCWNGQTRGR